jgi:hypothetical protein
VGRELREDVDAPLARAGGHRRPRGQEVGQVAQVGRVARELVQDDAERTPIVPGPVLQEEARDRRDPGLLPRHLDETLEGAVLPLLRQLAARRRADRGQDRLERLAHVG